jgi:hypothetical protein
LKELLLGELVLDKDMDNGFMETWLSFLYSFMRANLISLLISLQLKRSRSASSTMMLVKLAWV